MYTLFQTKMAKSIPYLRLEMHKNDTLWGGVCLCGLCKGVPPSPLLGHWSLYSQISGADRWMVGMWLVRVVSMRLVGKVTIQECIGTYI